MRGLNSILCVLLLRLYVPSAAAAPLDERDLPSAVEASRGWGFQWRWKYEGKPFSAPGTLLRILQYPSGDAFILLVMTRAGEVDCPVFEGASLRREAAAWRAGQPVIISGDIATVQGDDVTLAYGCSVRSNRDVDFRR